MDAERTEAATDNPALNADERPPVDGADQRPPVADIDERPPVQMPPSPALDAALSPDRRRPGNTPPEVTPPVGGSGPLQAYDTVVLFDEKDRRYMLRLEPGKVFHTTLGTLPHDEIIGRDEGVRLRTHKGRSLLCLRPTLEQYVLEIPRQTQIIFPKDLGAILMRGQIFPGARVFQSGIGSGALSVTLLRFLGPTGELISYENRAEFANLARNNIRRFLGTDPPNHQIEIRDVYAGIDARDVDTLILDVPEPNHCVAAAATALRPGGVLMVWLPTVLQVHSLVCDLRDSNSFDQIDTSESLVRPWYVTRISMRPEHRMVAHTGFLISARRCEPRHWGNAAGKGAAADASAEADAPAQAEAPDETDGPPAESTF